MKVGFIGLGTQGKYLAVNLAEAGHDLMVFDVRREPMDALAAAGAKLGRSAQEIGAHGEVVEICVLDDAQLDTVVLGAEGVLAGARRDTIIAVHSTVEPRTITRLAEACAARGVELIDVPVSGSEAGARAKTMSYMVGGSDRAFQKCRPLFETSGPKITHTGPLGTGIRAKLAHQLIIAVNLMAAYEGMRLGDEAGVPRDVLLKVVHEGAAQSRVADRWFAAAMNRNAPAVFYKDLQLGLKFARELGLSVPGAALAQQLLDRIVPVEGGR
ncbi:MAG TPA: NAD(P)-dependent oxidoreductase [Stellaceae bacterium]|nr:NAD(P)-dependent oxidoreductase [Stellaceae bacterium]